MVNLVASKGVSAYFQVISAQKVFPLVNYEKITKYKNNKK